MPCNYAAGAGCQGRGRRKFIKAAKGLALKGLALKGLAFKGLAFKGLAFFLRGI
ncbi:hypothetical protein JCM17846_16350 [Iodidimonas nitroreducens]|uniref:Uncharacterized protein n=1 Tax=Iodidimonas nitroreducens TaxID=1236968 RepID=A0A5A7N6J7_9PROT|nr:hypothetical protein JCM17846_16350 [Iodidimonas nitroreducens]